MQSAVVGYYHNSHAIAVPWSFHARHSVYYSWYSPQLDKTTVTKFCIVSFLTTKTSQFLPKYLCWYSDNSAILSLHQRRCFLEWQELVQRLTIGL